MLPKTKPPQKNAAIDNQNPEKLRLPFELDEMPDAHSSKPRKVMKQAYTDLKNGLVDTDLHGQQGAAPTSKSIAAPTPSSSKKSVRLKKI